MQRGQIRSRGAAIAVFALCALTACGATDQDAEPPTASAPTTQSPTPTLSDPGPGEGTEPEPLASPVDSDASQVSALDLATRAMIAFARPQASPDQWWSDLSPLLSDAARSAYTGTDPASVPANTVTGPAELLPSESGYLATATVPTDVGVYTILLSRDGQNAPWAVERLTPPASN